MNKKEIKHPDDQGGGNAAPFSEGILVDGWLFVSGQGPLDIKTGKVVHGTIEEETGLVLRHIEKILCAGGASMEDVVKCTCHLANIEDFDRFNVVYKKFFKGVLPARITVQSVLWGGIKVELDAIARIKK